MSSVQPLRRLFRRAAAPALGVLLALGVTVAMASPASANGSYSGRAYVYGAGVVSDDFNDEGVVNVSTNRLTNATCLWQTILYASGYLPASGIDGAFGDQTDAATRNFQRDRGLVVDGSAGKASWAKAGDRISQRDNQNGWLYIIFDGVAGSRSSYSSHDFVLQRSPDGNYRFYPPNGGPYWAGYNSRTCS